MSRVAILSSRSIFTEGVIVGLRQRFGADSVLVVDVRQADSLERVLAAQPASVIVDATDAEIIRHCPLQALIERLPAVAVFRLNPQKDRVTIVTSEQRPACQLSDVIEVISGVINAKEGKDTNHA